MYVYPKKLQSLLSTNSLANSNSRISDCYLRLSELYNVINQPSNASICYSQALIVCRDDTLLTCKVLIRLSKFMIGQSDFKFALQFLKCAQRLDASQMYTCDIQHYMGVCYMYIHSWRKSWLCLYLALNTYQLLPHSKPSDLAQVHLSIGQLLLHVGYISQSLEHSQLALDLTSNLLVNSKCRENVKLYKEIKLFRDSLHLVKIFCYQFYVADKNNSVDLQ